MNEQDYILIERYLSGDLSAEERALVESRITNEPAFAAGVDDRRQLNDHLRAVAAEETLRPTLEKLGDQYFPERTAEVRNLPRRRWYGYAIAAAVAVILLVAVPLLFPAGNSYDQFAQHEPLALTERSSGPGQAAAAEKAYNAGNYSAAIPLLQAYLDAQADDEQARLALGVSLLETDRDQEAIAIFKRIAEGQSSLAPYGNWYLALAAVKRGDDEAVRRFLDLIPASDAYLTKKANELRATL